MACRIQRTWRNYQLYRGECARRIQEAWRRNKDQIRHVQLREYGHQVLTQRKERRRFSLLSMRRFIGDYLRIGSDDSSESEIYKNACGIIGNLVFNARKHRSKLFLVLFVKC